MDAIIKLMNKKAAGFTIVELLVVIVVIAILAAITLVSYNNLQRRAYNTTAIASVQSWIKVLAASYALNGTISVSRASGDNSICLGEKSQYPYVSPSMKEGQCFSRAHTSDQLIASVSDVANISMKVDMFDKGDGALRGIQYAYFAGGDANIWYVLKGPGQDCGVRGATGETWDEVTECHVVINDLVGGVPIMDS